MTSQKLDAGTINELTGATCEEDGGGGGSAAMREEIADLLQNQNLLPPIKEWRKNEAEVRTYR